MLAVSEGCAMVTADERLVNALRPSAVGKHVAWIGSLGAAAKE
jgi:predicted nucleic acid-binding protein